MNRIKNYMFESNRGVRVRYVTLLRRVELSKISFTENVASPTCDISHCQQVQKSQFRH